MASGKRPRSESKDAPAPDTPAADTGAGGGPSFVDWPLPPFHELADEAAPSFENALVTFRNGRRQSGKLMRFSPASGAVEFRPEGGAAAAVLPLSEVLEIRLVRPVRLRPRPSRLDAQVDPAARPAVQTFRLTLADGSVVEGETAGFQVHSIGLFLYLPSHQNVVVRTFHPAVAIRDKQIGKRLGAMLVERQQLTPAQLDGALGRQVAERSQKLGEFLTGERIVSQEALVAALRDQRSRPLLRLGEALLKNGTITQEQLDAALARQKQQREKPLGELLVDTGTITRGDLTQALTQKLGIPYVDLAKFQIDRRVLDLVPRTTALEFNMLPLCLDGRTLVVALENPLDPKPLDHLRFTSGMNVVPVMASAEDIRRAIARHFVDPLADAPVETIAAELETPGDSADGTEDIDDSLAENDSALVRLVNRIIADARTSGASDIHVEANPGRNLMRIRFRQDGALREYLTLPAAYRRSLVSRIKIMASLDISERRRGQDGKVRVLHAGAEPLDLRVATIPTRDGCEDVVLRLLSGGKPIPIDDLGLREGVRRRVEALSRQPHGLFIVCGPTGSGKSTTLHSVLGHINQPDLKIWTAEDPVEIQQEGLRQVQVNPRAGWTFAAALRSFLRADPDVIMVGEMRDEETAQIAIEAALTGHLVFSTLHTNTAVDSVLRLLDMGVQPFNFADSLLGVLAQRLVRKLCPDCRAPVPLDEEGLAELAEEYCDGTSLSPHTARGEWARRGQPLQLWQAKGCDACRGSGYRGRIGVHELFVNTPETTPLIHRRAEAQALRSLSIAEGMRTLKQDGIEKCLDGLTDLTEVRANCA